ncbi:ABC transporter substrate-binding protein [Caulobacter endophyticus]|uniref:ABC transporter substrate-binding protein n=1 Tax=Caulobacter endophyticus TaxID=2172652 RepID=UPI00240F1CDB|nr:ABC transporter substrate-binding protein [Caulobacter endophyticus]MDG2527912.1 ABC transporter substrate-binding protein [Caulobacter endophyticus]
MTDAITRRAATAGLLSLTAAALPVRPSLDGAAQRVVSIGSCLDLILMEVADRRQVAALSHFSRDPDVSIMAARARTFPFTREGAEEVVALDPDLVLASKRSGLYTRTALKARGLRVEEFDVPNKVEDSLDQIHQIAALVGRPDRGEAVVARVRAAIAAAAPRPDQPRLSALIYQPGGLVAGRGTLVGDMLERCGFDNYASHYGLKKWGNVSLEALLADPPTVLLAGSRWEGAPSWADRVISHPALKSLEPNTFRGVFHQRLLYCGGPVLVQTAAALAKAREDALAWNAGRPQVLAASRR